jgi:predicted transcriptional regulator
MSEPEATLFEKPDPNVEDAALAEAEAAIAKGRVVSHDAIRKWLRSWGKPDELPPPKCGE